MEQRNRKKIITFLQTLWITMSLMLVPSVAHADLTCETLNDPAETKNYVISIIEEQLGNITSTTADTDHILQCFRQTTCDQETQECRSEYVSSCSPSDTVTCQRVQAFVSQSGLGLLFSYIGTIYRWSAGVIGIVSVFYLVYGGIKIATAGDNTAAIDDAKAKIIQSLAGLILLFISAVVLYTINPNFFTLG